MYKNKEKSLINNGYKIVRHSSNIIFFAFFNIFFILKNRNNFDFLIEEVNTVPLFSFFVAGRKTKKFLIYHQLARKVGRIKLRKLYLILVIIFLNRLFIYSTLAKIANSKIITISESSKKDLIKFGFKREDINIFLYNKKMPEIKKEEIRNKLNSDIFKVLFHSSLRSMKRPEEAVESFCLFLNSLSKEDRFFV